MEAKIKIKEIALSKNDQWWNIVSSDDKKISVNIAKAPKLAVLLKDAKPGDEITGNLTTKGEDSYLWDLDEKKTNGQGGNKQFAPKDKSYDAAIAAANVAASYYSLDKDGKSDDKLIATANKVYDFIMSKVTKAPEQK